MMDQGRGVVDGCRTLSVMIGKERATRCEEDNRESHDVGGGC